MYLVDAHLYAGVILVVTVYGLPLFPTSWDFSFHPGGGSVTPGRVSLFSPPPGISVFILVVAV